MIHMNNQQIKKKILSDIETAKKKGYTIVSGSWGNDAQKCACALSCIYVADGVEIIPDPDEAADILEVDRYWTRSFIDGFDGLGAAEGATVPSAWGLGREIRAATNPIDYEKWRSILLL